MNSPRFVRALAGLAASLLIAGCGSADFHESRSASSPDVPGSAIRVSTENGSIAVSAGGAKSAAVKGVQIDADIFATTAARAAAVKIVSERDAAGALSIRAEWPGGKREPSEGCSFEIDVPVTTGSVDAKSQNGAIHVKGRCGAVTARTSNGAVDVEGAPGRVEAISSNGAVSATLDDASEGPAILETSNGSIRLVFGSGFHGSLSAETANGEVEIDANDPKTGAPFHVAASKFETLIGVGGGASRLKTSNGAIRIESRKK